MKLQLHEPSYKLCFPLCQCLHARTPALQYLTTVAYVSIRIDDGSASTHRDPRVSRLTFFKGSTFTCLSTGPNKMNADIMFGEQVRSKIDICSRKEAWRIAGDLAHILS